LPDSLFVFSKEEVALMDVDFIKKTLIPEWFVAGKEKEHGS